MRNRSIIYLVVAIMSASWFWLSEMERVKQKRAINLVFHARATAVTNSIIRISSSAPLMDTFDKLGFSASNRVFSPAMEQMRAHAGTVTNGMLIAAWDKMDKRGYEHFGLLSQREFSAGLEHISSDGCPTDFKEAWNGYVAAWKAHCSFSTSDRLFDIDKVNRYTEGFKFGAVNMDDEHKDVESAWIRCEYFASTYHVEDTSDFDF
jgi:hypothetical protein